MDVDPASTPNIPSDNPTHPSTNFDPFLDINSNDEDSWRDPTTGGIPLRAKKPDRGYDAHQCLLITAVHTSGIHELRMLGKDIPIFDQMLYMRLYPASRKKTQTVFTFEALDDYDLENLETKASAAKHYDKLTHLTANAFPTMVPNRYQLLFIAREWRNLKARQRAGYAYILTDAIPARGLALFCPTCPQPGINLPDDWKDDPDRKKYMRTLASRRKLQTGSFKDEV
ncbi:hypothetical protein QCA50_008505 [Cerrena zonata]|uniref:CxC2-like cysteine cluster KDZ transposase-associated domain-containing protein n=1 Tax=Cerrena zonata TaxID=2478898 RepID=A0AAW0GGJ9_9APHY